MNIKLAPFHFWMLCRLLPRNTPRGTQ